MRVGRRIWDSWKEGKEGRDVRIKLQIAKINNQTNLMQVQEKRNNAPPLL